MTALVAVLGTVVSYLAADRIASGLGRPALASPALWASLGILATLAVLDVEVTSYVDDAGPLRWLLGPATVALGVPLARTVRRLERRRAGARIAVAIFLGGVVTSAVAALVAAALGATRDVVTVAATKSVSTPIALAVDLPVEVDGLLAASCVVTGVYGAVVLPALARRLSLERDHALGTGVGVTAHAIGSAELRRCTPDAVGWAVAGLALNGVLTTLWLPPVIRLVM